MVAGVESKHRAVGLQYVDLIGLNRTQEQSEVGTNKISVDML